MKKETDGNKGKPSLKTDRRYSSLLLFAVVMIGFCAVATCMVNAAEVDQLDLQLRLLREEREFFGDPMLKNIIMILFLVIGPFKIIPAFAKLTVNASDKLRKKLAFRGFWISTVTILVVALIGQVILANYRISLTALMTAAGLVLTIVATRSILGQYVTRQEAEPPPKVPSLSMAISPLIFPIVLPPYGIAIVLLLMIIGSRVDANANLVLVIVMVYMVLNYVCMLFARAILKVLKPEFLRVVGLVLGIIQLAIGISWVYGAVRLEAMSIWKMIGS